MISNDGWSWVLAWAQLGVHKVSCIPLGELALQQLKLLESHHALSKIVRRADWQHAGTSPSQKPVLLCGHFGASSWQQGSNPDQDELVRCFTECEMDMLCLVSVAHVG